MLDRAQLSQQLEQLSSKIFVNRSHDLSKIKEVWVQMAEDPLFSIKAQQAQGTILVPSWDQNLDSIYEVGVFEGSYTAVAVDGSQIYPDRHMSGASCCLLNVGGASLHYGSEGTASFFSSPRLFLPEDLVGTSKTLPFTTDLIDIKRAELEFEFQVQESLRIRSLHKGRDNEIVQPLCFTDGTLVFWYLESKDPQIKEKYLSSYVGYLEQLYQNNIPILGFISLPKSRELINLIRIYLCPQGSEVCTQDQCPCACLDGLIDTHLLRTFLPSNHRTTVFYSHAKITHDYPVHLRPSFFYMNLGNEIVRIEIPVWIAQNDGLCTLVAQVAYDQSMKGRGYPVCLAEAHEQAVVKGVDRDFFYHLLHKMSLTHGRRVVMSQKSIKKRGLGI